MASRHSVRLGKFSDEPGTFVYDGSSVAIEDHPTPLKTGQKDPVYDDAGLPIIDKNGNQVYQTPGMVKKDANGNVILGGKPKRVEVKLESRTVFGVEFVAGKSVFVDKPGLAQKLRVMGEFKEVAASKTEASADLSTLDGLLTLSKKELVAMAEKAEIALEAGSNKAEIAEAILAGRG